MYLTAQAGRGLENADPKGLDSSVISVAFGSLSLYLTTAPNVSVLGFVPCFQQQLSWFTAWTKQAWNKLPLEITRLFSVLWVRHTQEPVPARHILHGLHTGALALHALTVTTGPAPRSDLHV